MRLGKIGITAAAVAAFALGGAGISVADDTDPADSGTVTDTSTATSSASTSDAVTDADDSEADYDPGDVNSADAADDTTESTSIDEVVSCAFKAVKPFFVTAGGRLYGQGKITGCTVPAPDECHLVVELEQKVSVGWSVVASKDNGWKACTVKHVNVTYKCPQVLIKHSFRTLVSLAIVYNGQTGGNVAVSKSYSAYC